MSFVAAALIGGSLAAGGAIGGAAISSASASQLSEDAWKRNEELWGGELYKQLPDYPEASGAREEWWKKLQEWGGQPGYGAIAPNWEDIWSRAKNKLTQYYWGGTLDTGLAGKVQASAARRNVSQSPALENMLTAMGFQEAQDVRELAGTQAEKEAAFSETGRQNWLTSLTNLAGQKPAYMTRTGVTSQSAVYGAGNMLADVSGEVGNLFSQYAQQEYLTQQKQQEQDWFMKLFNQSGGGGGTSLSSNLGAAKETSIADLFGSLGVNQ